MIKNLQGLMLNQLGTCLLLTPQTEKENIFRQAHAKTMEHSFW
jgi:hypothetical protein